MQSDEIIILPGLEEYFEKTIDISTNSAPTCLALTVQKKYMPIAIKNVLFHSMKLSFKIAISTFFATFLKLFI